MEDANKEDETSDDNGNDGGEANNDEEQTIGPGDDVEPVEDSNNDGEEDGQAEEEEAEEEEEEEEGEAYDEIDLKEGHVLVTWVQTNLKKITEEDSWETEEDPNDLIIVDRYCQYINIIDSSLCPTLSSPLECSIRECFCF